MDGYLWMTVMCLTILYLQGAIAEATKRVYVKEGSEVELMCTVTENNEAIIWLGPPNRSIYAVGNNIISTFKFVALSEYNKTYSTLKISEMSADKEGSYSCLYRASTDIFEIRIKKNPSNLRVASEKDNRMIYGVEGKDLSLECTVNRGEPAGNITWTCDDYVYAVDGPERVNYNLRPGRPDHNKVFTCTAYNSEGEKVESRNVRLFIFYKPVVTISAKPSQVVREGQDLELNCRNDGNDPNATIEWIRNGTKRLVNDDTLILSSVKRQESGEYKCEVSTKGGPGVSSIIIEIQYAPTVTIIKRQRNDHTYVLECMANGVPNNYFFSEWEQKTEWFEHVRFVKGSTNDNLTLQNDPSIELGYYQNSGIYVCSVSNNISDTNGSIHQMAHIYVRLQGKPIFLYGNDQNQHAIYGRNGIIRLFVYSVPKYNSLYIISGKTSLRLQSNNNQDNFYFEENEGPVQDRIYDNLVTVRAYRISVKIKTITEADFTNHTIYITNSLGTATFTVRLISANRPEPPFNVSAKPATNTISVSWNSGFNGGYPQTFVLQYKKLGVLLQSEWVVRGEVNDTRQETYSVAIDGLEFDMQYIVCVFAYNVMNSSEIRCTDPIKTDLAESTSMGLPYVISSVVFGVVMSFLLVMLKHKYKVPVSVILHTSCSQSPERTPDPDEEYRVVLSTIEPFAASNQLYSTFSRPHAGFLMDQNGESSVFDRDFFNRKDKVEDRTNHIFENEYHQCQDKVMYTIWNKHDKFSIIISINILQIVTL